MKSVFIYLSLCVLTVAGCGSSSSDPDPDRDPVPVPVGPAEASMGIVPSMVTLDYDEVMDVLTLTDGVTPAAMTAFATYDAPGFAGYFVSSSGDNYGNEGETSSGAGRVATVSSTGGSLGVSGTFFERVGDTLVPKTGTATYTGNYVSYVANATSLNAFRQVTGDAELNFDFSDASVDGMITDRTAAFSADTFANILLEEGSIVDGAFSGTTTGGEIDAAGATVAAGEYEGLLTGANAEEAVGGVHMTHTIGGTDYFETGAFIVEE